MARILDSGTPSGVDAPWRLLLTVPGLAAVPEALPVEGWIPATVPGTAAGALRAAGFWDPEAPTPLHAHDVWYATTLEGHGPRRLAFEGLATLAEVFLDGRPVLAHASMFRPAHLDLTLSGRHALALVFRALGPALAKPAPRGRWRPLLATPGSLRNVRTTLLGHMAGWCPPIHTVGPYRPVTCRPPSLFHADLRSDLDGSTGRVTLRLTHGDAPLGESPSLVCAGAEAPLRPVSPGVAEAELVLSDVAPWWPHTHGTPVLHAAAAIVAGRRLDLGCVGFRRIAVDRGPDGHGFGLLVNGVPVFCRGAVWTPPDLTGLPVDEAAFAPHLDRAVEAGMNMLRVGGTTLYEADAFYRACDARGVLVWQDAMLANFDYPDDPAFRTEIATEIEAFLDRTQASPCLAVLCGGSEASQQPAMLGLPAETWANALVREVIPGVAARLRPDLATVENSPCGGDLPFDPAQGIAHYYGVGAYRRPLSDARDANVRFAAECLGFANLPEADSPALDGLPALNDPAWRSRVPRDRGTDWDFEDVRDHYLALLTGVDPAAMRANDPARYAALSRAVVAQVMEASFAAWRRGGSPTRGGLVWHLTDLAPGAGWGVIDAAGRPKSAWWGLRRMFRPLGLALSDEGLSGLALHVWNEGETPRAVALDLACLTDEGRVAVAASRSLTLAPRETLTLTASALLGRFFDTTAAYGFGPPAHALCVARITDPATGALLAEAFHFPQGLPAAPRDTGLSVALGEDGEGWFLDLACERTALSLHVADAAGFVPDDDWFHLAPARPRRLRLARGTGVPHGRVAVVNDTRDAPYGAAP